jgi:PAS domain S-box-containing protein
VTDYAIYMLDPAGNVVSWNAGAQRFKGYAPQEILGRHFSRFYTEEDNRAGLPLQVLETAERVGKFEGEGWRRRKDGTRFWAHIVVDPIRSPSGELLGFATVNALHAARYAGRAGRRDAFESSTADGHSCGGR